MIIYSFYAALRSLLHGECSDINNPKTGVNITLDESIDQCKYIITRNGELDRISLGPNGMSFLTEGDINGDWVLENH